MTWTKVQYFQRGWQYYVAGRYAVFADFIPVSANLLHHAVEMFLKGHLTTSLTETERKDLGHKLSSIWEHFKSDLGDASLAGYADVITDLNRFENGRYPERVVSEGGEFFVGRGRVEPSRVSVSKGAIPSYRLSLGMIDELVASIFRCTSMNSEAFKSPNKHELEFLRRENPHFG